MSDDLFFAALDSAEISASQYRTAVRLWRRTEPGSSYTRLSYEEAMSVCGTSSDHTTRGHLSALAAAGLLVYQRNHAVHIWWKVIAPRAERAPDARHARQESTESDNETSTPRVTRAERAPTDHDDGNGDEVRAPDARHARQTRATRAGRAPRAPGDHPNTINTGRLVGRDLLPTYLPGGTGGDRLTPDQERSLALLTDPEFGMDEPTARHLAQQYPFRQVRAHAVAVLRDVQAERVQSVYVLPARLKRGGQPKVLDSDRASPIWLRHGDAPEEGADPVTGESADELVRKYSLE